MAYRNGAENIPLQKINTSMPAMVYIYDLNNEDYIVMEKQIDFASFDDRKWMGRITHWALTNHHSVETIALVDAEAPINKE